MDKVYNPQKFEWEIYRKWEESGVFSPEYGEREKKEQRDRKGKFTILMPPPNANDPLHIGHAMFVAIEDILIRYQRMRGKAALWLPGTDHAGIETQYVFEKKLAKEGKSRFDFDRETLYKMIWDYVKENSDVAINQMKRLGASADWSRLAFTLDEEITDQVIETFRKLHEDRLVYRGLRLVNYCTRCGTSFSNLEVKDVVRKDPLLYMKYGPFTIATVRPETKFRDTALAVNPKDKRYKKYIGKTFEIMGLVGPIKMTVIADPEVDPDFGTGIMKVTPAHDFHDFELGKKYNLAVTPIIGFDGKMDFSWFLENPNNQGKHRERAQTYHGQHVSKVRAMMIEDLKEDSLLVKIDEAYEHSVATCYKCGSVLEPLPLPQFFIKIKPLAKKALAALLSNKVKIIGAGHDKILRHWLADIEDWNISRQIVWGIRIPVWYCMDCYAEKVDITLEPTETDKTVRAKFAYFKKHSIELNQIIDRIIKVDIPVNAEYMISKDKPINCPKCKFHNLYQETDTFDTWFSSGQWPVVTLKREKEEGKSDFERFYPTDVMETGYDILPFWVMRMLMLGIYLTGKSPFKTVYLHGLIRDEKGQKMSKSKGNVINPLTMVEKYGADALRMALIIRSTPGQDKGVGENDIRGMRNLTNKIWNAARFIIMKRENPKSEIRNPKQIRNSKSQLSKHDQEFYKRLGQISKDITKQLEDFRIGLAAETVYNEFWHWFCDEAIESNKREELNDKAILEGLVTFLKLLHPFVPFVTEAVWQEIGEQRTANSEQTEEMLISTKWPEESRG